jgi:hypothetical protein
MKNPIVFVFSLLVLCSCSKEIANMGTDSSQYPMLIADKEHQFSASSQKRNPYEITATSGIRLDVGHFHFTEGGATFNGGGAAVTSDTVQIWEALANVGIYRLAKPVITNVFVLDASTLNVIHGSAFSGFRSGHNFIVSVGRATPDNIAAVWVGLITVK